MARWSEAKRAEVRARILDAARDEFEREGFESASMRTIASTSGVAVGTLFNYYADKRELLFAALHDDLEAVKERVLRTLPCEGTGLDELFVHVAGTFFDYYALRPALSRALLGESLFAEGDAGAAFRAQVESVADALVTRAESLRGAGALRPDACARTVVLAFVSHYYFVLLMELRGVPNPARMRGLIRALAEQLLRGVAATKPQGAAP